MSAKWESCWPRWGSSEHLKFSGCILRAWITQIFNAILLLECIPSSFKVANITPVYKRKGKDPLNPNSYRGIGVSNVLSKLFESLTLSRMLPELGSRGFPPNQQTAYQHGKSCEDATFSVFETLSYLTQNGNNVFQIFYDLEKAFDSVEYCILLKHLYSRGINGIRGSSCKASLLTPFVTSSISCSTCVIGRAQ